MPQSESEINGLWNYAEVARFLKCSISNAKRLPLPRVQLGRLVRFHPEQIREWVGSYSIPRRPERG